LSVIEKGAADLSKPDYKSVAMCFPKSRKNHIVEQLGTSVFSPLLPAALGARVPFIHRKSLRDLDE
jgi:hypothetical protein